MAGDRRDFLDSIGTIGEAGSVWLAMKLGLVTVGKQLNFETSWSKRFDMKNRELLEG